MIISQHTKKTHLQEKIAKSVIWLFVGITIAVLAWIVIYVLVKGFYYSRDVTYDVTNHSEEQLILGQNLEPVVFIAHSGVRVKDLTVENLRTIYTKARKEKWGPYTTQNLAAETFILKDGSRFTEQVISFIQGDNEEINDYAVPVPDVSTMIEKVRKTKGAIGYVPASSIDQLKKVKIIPVRRISAVLHPSVKEIVNNIQLQEITSKELQEIFLGNINNWSALGGIDLPVVPVLPPMDVPPCSVILKQILGNLTPGKSVKVAASKDEFFSIMENTPGAVGVCFYDMALSKTDSLKIEEIRRTESGWNMTIHFLIEEPSRSGAWGGVSTIIINTFFLILFTLIFSTPVGVLGAIYLVEYAKQGRLLRILRLGTETLAGIPSIVFGLFGSIFFVNMLGLGIGFISATLTVTMMVLPTIIRTSEEALKSVPQSFREGSLALGATKLQTIAKVVIPAATPGILTGIILAVGRTVGETAVLIYTLGSNYELVRGPSSSARVLSLHLYALFSEAISFERAFSTGAILIFIVLIVNYSTTKLIGRMNKLAGK